MLAHLIVIISIKKASRLLQKETVNSEGKSPRTPRKSVSKESVSKATSELNNLLQIISGTSAEIGNLWEGSEDSEQYLNMLRSSIDRAEAVAAQLAEQAGGTDQKVLMHQATAERSWLPSRDRTIGVRSARFIQATAAGIPIGSARSDNALHGRRRNISSSARNSRRNTGCSVHRIYSARSTRPIDEGWNRGISAKAARAR